PALHGRSLGGGSGAHEGTGQRVAVGGVPVVATIRGRGGGAGLIGAVGGVVVTTGGGDQGDRKDECDHQSDGALRSVHREALLGRSRRLNAGDPKEDGLRDSPVQVNGR